MLLFIHSKPAKSRSSPTRTGGGGGGFATTTGGGGGATTTGGGALACSAAIAGLHIALRDNFPKMAEEK